MEIQMYRVTGDFINDEHGRPYITLGYCPTGQKKALLLKICGWLNLEIENKEAENFSALAHKMSVHEEFGEEEPDFVESKNSYMEDMAREFREGGKL
jgi:hypothetical protein